MGDATNIFNDAARDILDAMTDEVDAEFIPLADAPVEVRVYVDYDYQAEPAGYQMQAGGSQITILARILDLPSIPVAAVPGERGEYFVISDTTYEVTAILENDAIFVLCAVKEID